MYKTTVDLEHQRPSFPDRARFTDVGDHVRASMDERVVELQTTINIVARRLDGLV